jgi:hypothetical protein
MLGESNSCVIGFIQYQCNVWLGLCKKGGFDRPAVGETELELELQILDQPSELIT